MKLPTTVHYVVAIRNADPPILRDAVCDSRMSMGDYARLGWFWARRTRRQAQQWPHNGSVYQAAVNLKKQGVPLRVARLLLAKGKKCDT